MLRLSLEKTRQLIVAGVLTCVELLRLFQSKGSWVSLPPEIAQIRKALSIEDYVLLYEDLQKIGVCFLLAFVNKEVFQEQGKIFESLNTEDQQKFLEGYATEMQEVGDVLEGVFDFSQTEGEKETALKVFNALPVEEQQEQRRTLRFLYTAFLSATFNRPRQYDLLHRATNATIQREGSETKKGPGFLLSPFFKYW